MATDLCINNIRVLAAEVVQKAKSGHPGAPMGCAPMAHALFSALMNFSPKNPEWLARDRFVLSNGHASALQYVMLHLCGYEVSMDDLKQFRQLDSITPGHPENHITPGVEVTTGPLGQGIANAVGLAIAEKNLASTFNKPDFELFNNYTYAICGDGCLQEGVALEAISLAGHLELGKLVLLWDNNGITIDGKTDISFTEDVLKKMEACNWHVQHVEEGNYDVKSITEAIEKAKAVTDKPSFISVKTTIGFGSAKEGTSKVHGAPLGDDGIINLKKKFNFDSEKTFFVEPAVYDVYKAAASKGNARCQEWEALFQNYCAAFPDQGVELQRRMRGELPKDLEGALPTFSPEDAPKATRQLSASVLNACAKVMPEIIGGSADLVASNLTYIENGGDFQPATPAGRNIHFGIREHAMAAVSNGLYAYGCFLPFCATFMNFVGYLAGAFRVSAISHFPILYVMTHDSIGVGEDGPTHQPIETLPFTRAMPNVLTFRPADGNETSGAYLAALRNRTGPSMLALTRQGVPHLQGSSFAGVAKGAYVLQDCDGTPDLILAASGSEVSLCVQAAAALAANGRKIRVVSFPCWELFEKQEMAYKKSIFPAGVPVLAVEMGATTGWGP
eukprot:GCRY01000939.1.p1 GENE.GCRY01000939.1~~GCRY01000939.1.p1  ORF type:complete len:617 (-),score=189.92 GCRY01000939.1:1-1851(-)